MWKKGLNQIKVWPGVYWETAVKQLLPHFTPLIVSYDRVESREKKEFLCGRLEEGSFKLTWVAEQ